MKRPIVQVSCIQELFHEIEEPSVLDVFGVCRNDEIMIETSKAICGSGSLEQDGSLSIVAMEKEEQAGLVHHHRLGKR